MVKLKSEEKQIVPKKEPSNAIPIERRIPLFFLVMLIICTVSYFSLDTHWVENIFAHLGGLSIMGLLGCSAGTIAKKKGYGYWKAVLLVLFLPIILGIIAVSLFRPISCGGSISLAVAVLIVIIYSLVKHVDVNKPI
jgi:lipopolysaccharide export LptBFGC system permease protein LptF